MKQERLILSDDYYNSLPAGYQLEHYQITRVLGAGGFGIAYLAKDTRLDTDVVLKEYLPNEISVREQTTSKVLPKDSSSADDYESGLKEYIKEARTIAKFDHPNIVQVKNYIEANNTAYIVMSYVEGTNLSKLAKGETATEEEIKLILFPLLDGLKEVHKHGYLHRDIKPSNIFIQKETKKPVLIDFGAARFHLGVCSKSMTSVVTAGYSPYEQYYTGGNQGAWTDIYAMGGVLYRLISGKSPVESPSRIMKTMDGQPDNLRKAVDIGKDRYSFNLLNAIDHALEIKPLDRPQSIEKWLFELNDKKEVSKVALQNIGKQSSNDPKSKKEKINHQSVIIFLLILLSITSLTALFFPNIMELNSGLFQNITESTDEPADVSQSFKENRKARQESILVLLKTDTPLLLTKEEAAKEKAAKKEAIKKEAIKKEAAKKEAIKKEAAKKEAAKKEKAAKKEAIKKEAAKKEAIKKEAAKKEAIKEKAAKKEAIKEKATNKEKAKNLKLNCLSGDKTHKAAAQGNVPLLKKCLNSGVSVNQKEGNKWTPLHSASRGGSLKAVQLLLSHGAKINAVDITGRTPLDQAIIGGHKQIASILRKKGGKTR